MNEYLAISKTDIGNAKSLTSEKVSINREISIKMTTQSPQQENE